MRGPWILLALILGGMAQGVAFAQLSDDPDEEIARRRFARGSAHYAAGEYQQALDEFEAVKRLKPAPALDYNIARCLDRLERPRDAIAAYERYVAARPNAPDAPEVRARIDVVRARLPAEPPAATAAPPTAPPSPPTAPPAAPPEIAPAASSAAVVVESPPSRARPYIAPIAVGAGAIALAVVGGGLLGSVRSDFDAAAGPGGCRPCSDDEIAPLQRRAHAGYALLGIAGALVVVDVALFAVTARKRATAGRR
jgi:tetratricopeptide (TPR) repeat protein